MDARVATLTMNPALDVHTEVLRVVPEEKLRCAEPVREPGGGGINVARALRRLGLGGLAVFPCGGEAGRRLADLLRAEEVATLAVPVAGSLRENLHVVERETGRQYRFCLPGPALADAEWRACFEAAAAEIDAGAFVVASGSLPPGVPDDLYARLARRAREAGARFALDSSGEPLRRAAAEGVYLLKPSRREFEELTGCASGDPSVLAREGKKAIASGMCEVLVISLGARGAVWVSREGAGSVSPPSVAAASSVGAGDSLVAGIVRGLLGGQELPEAVRLGVAAAASCVRRRGTGLCRAEEIGELLAGTLSAALSP